MFNIFTTQTILTRIIASEGAKPEAARSQLFKMLRAARKVYVGVDSAESSGVEPLVSRHGINPDTSKSDYVNGIPSHPETVLRHPSSLFILNISPSEASGIQKTYGVMCLSGDDANISSLIDINDIFISAEREKLGSGWDSVLNSVETLPSNALLLTDRYLFAFRHPNAGDGIANIHDILQQLLPKQFTGGEYHVTIIFDNQSKHTSYTFNDIATQINKLKSQLRRDYPIMMEVLGITPDCSIYNRLHNRLIISNYYFVEAAHKLAAFNRDRGTARQTLIPMTLFTDSSLSGTSTPPLKVIDQTLTTLRDFSASLSTLADHSVYLYAVNGKRMDKCMGIRNRMLR
jgi:hypothetical protein